MGRTQLGGGIALGFMLAGLIHGRINARKAHHGAASGETPHIPDFSHQLRCGDFSDAVHGAYRFVFGKLSGKPEHLLLHGRQSGSGNQELLGCCGDQQLGIGVFGKVVKRPRLLA